MDHQLFESWLFESKQLNPQQKLQLETHLSSCKHCRDLASAWQHVETQLNQSVMVSPDPGFAKRWKASLPSRKIAHQKEDGRRWLLELSGGAALTLLVLIVLNSNSQSALSFLGRLVQIYTGFTGFFDQVRNFMYILANTIPNYIWIAIIIALASWLVVAGLVWTYTLTRLKKGTTANETAK